MTQFTWLPFFEEMLSIICDKYDKTTLCEVFHQIFKGTGSTSDKYSDGTTGPLREIDPLSFISFFNRGITDDNRMKFCRKAKTVFDMNSETPTDFDGIPAAQNQKTWFFDWEKNRHVNDISNLWMFSKKINEEKIDNDIFKAVSEIKQTGIAKMTQLMFICKPTKYVSFDSRNRTYFHDKGLFIDLDPRQEVLRSPRPYDRYLQLLDEIKKKFNKPLFQISRDAYLYEPEIPEPDDEESEDSIESIGIDPANEKIKYWIIAPGEQARLWKHWLQEHIIAIGWDDLGDLNQYKNKDEVGRKLQEVYDSSKSQDKSAYMVNAFFKEMQPGDIVFAKKGTRKLLGYGVVKSDYYYAPDYEEYHHVRKVEWVKTGDWDLPDNTKAHVKTLTGITQYSEYLDRIKKIVGFEDGFTENNNLSARNFWWLNANPKIWNFSDIKIGEKQTYTTHNEKGNKRRIYKHFTQVQPGDLVIGYLASPDKEITAICRISKGLHRNAEGEVFEFEKIEDITIPVTLEELKDTPGLSNCEPLINNQGSLFKLTADEYDLIRSLIDEKNEAEIVVEVTPYPIEKALKGLFFKREEFEDILEVLRFKKNIILQGAPGVGKTFIAQRLAFTLMEEKAPQRVQMIQFHQSYSYEDFIQGYRPNDKENFALKNGLFHEFCKKAQRDPDNKYVFIIDEINRGNLSKIFGELMMLIEADKRGKEFAVPLTYAQAADEKFYIPENLYLIGTMNTADRSLAMVDYALRRRFSFISLSPKFDTSEFRAFMKSKNIDADLIEKIIARMTALNTEISRDEKNLGIGYQIGHSFFCPTDGLTTYDHAWYQRVVRHEIRPLLEEYWFDNLEDVNRHVKTLLG